MKRSTLALFAVLIVDVSAASAAEPSKRQCINANETAQDLQRAGKLHEAKADLAVCLSAACPRLLREDCAQRLTEVEAALPTVVFEVKDPSGHDLGAVRVTMDGQSVVGGLDGSAIPIDPGSHNFVFEAEAFRKKETTIILHEGEKSRRVSVVLEPEVASGTDGAGTAAGGVPASAPGEASGRGADESKTSTRSVQRALGLAIGGAGVVSLIVGSVFGLMAKSTYDLSASECALGGCSQQAAHDRQTAFDQATVATIACLGGGALLAGGLVLTFTAQTTAAGPTLGASAVPGGAGIGWRGIW